MNKALLNEIWKLLLHQCVRKICDTSTLGGRAMGKFNELGNSNSLGCASRFI